MDFKKYIQQYYDNKQYDDALAYLFDTLNKGNADEADVYFEIAKIYSIQNNQEQTAVYLLKTLDLLNSTSPSYKYVIELLEITYKLIKNNFGLKHLSDKIKLKLNINDEKNIYAKYPGDYGFNGNYNHLIDIYKGILKGDPSNNSVLCFLAQTYNYLGLYQNTIDLYKKNLENVKHNKFFENKFLNEYEIASKKTVLQSKPRNLMAVLSNKCNLKCIMCTGIKNNWELPKERLDEIIELFPYLEKILWQGGEVLLLPYFKDILRSSMKYPNIRQSFISNFQLADSDIIELIVKNNIELMVSIDGVTKDVYENIRQGSDFNRLCENLSLLNETRKKIKNSMALNMNVVVMRENYKQLPLFADFAKKYNFDFVSLTPVRYSKTYKSRFHNPKAAHNTFENDLTKEEFLELKEKLELTMKKAVEYNLNFDNRLDINNFDDEIILEKNTDNSVYLPEEEIKNVDNDDWMHVKENYLQDSAKKMICHLPWYSLTLDFNASARPNCLCPFANNVGYLQNESIMQLWNNKKMQQYRHNIACGSYSTMCSAICQSCDRDNFNLKLL
jgi:MoaA/NifB/PqqE/SkfB family radical SAM enzyme